MPTKPRKPKKVSYELIARDSVVGHPMYALLDELVDLHHPELRQARIAVAWCTSWNPDVDGRVKLGMCRKSSDLDRELSQWDFIILLRRSFWQHEQVTPMQRRALLDHELHHAAPKLDPKTHEQVYDVRDRPVWRTRRHDLEEFTGVVERYGCYTRDLEQFAAALRRSAAEPFTPCTTCGDTANPGWVQLLDHIGTPRMTRCGCYLRWVERRAELRDETAAVSA